VGVRKLSREEARRITIRAQLLDAERPTELLTVVEQLTFLQLDPTAAIAPSADLVAWSRLGGGYEPAHLTQALADRTLFEHRAQPSSIEPAIVMVRPMADLGPHLAEMVALRTRTGRVTDWLEANDEFRRRVLDQLAERDPDAGAPGLARAGRRLGAARTPAPLGPGRARLPRRRRCAQRGGGADRHRRGPAAIPGPGPTEGGRGGR
jgi:uncharacterized protein YcaQ